MKVVWSTTALAVGCVGSAQSKAMDTSKTLRRFAFGSNIHQDLPQPIWRAIEKTNPELFLSLGNNVRRRHSHRRPFFSPLPSANMRCRFTAMTRRSNDGNKEFDHRELSQELFLDFIGELEDSPRRKQAGIYTSYTFGSGDQAVKLLLLDNRYHKDPYVSKHAKKNVTDFNGQNGDILGDAQWTWLAAQLHESTAAFHVIGSALQVLPNDRWFGTESYSAFSVAHRRFVDLLQVSNASGVVSFWHSFCEYVVLCDPNYVFMYSGNVEFAEINQVECGATNAFKLTEVTSSGLTHSALEWTISPFHLASAFWYTVSNALLPWHYRLNRHAHFGGLNFGDVQFDWTTSPPTAVVSVKDVRGRVKLQTVFPSTKFGEPAENAGCEPIHAVSPGSVMVRVMALFAIMTVFFASVLVNVVVIVVVPLQILRRLVFGQPVKPKAD
ncbi:hypothetical protein DYB31_000732 [Aphanomyces astaci]|uniref:PhoD-like phosphatase metallophosphatase domain-containing protein n=1 Tax=Aphanomyces astaci TaxID=112090 RepID=A0A397F907_APHAT|nr:hypothetical protein DYB31_000732 [Aphanomyces astaci]